MKFVTIALGILLVVGGVYCMLTPVSTYATLAWLIGVAMVAEGLAGIITWNSARKEGLANGWTLAGAILSLVMGVFLLGSYVMQFAVDMFIAYLIAFWLIEAGVVRIVVAVGTRNSYGQEGSSGWILQVVLGVLIVVLGILSIFNPLSIVLSVGTMLGISVLFVGLALVVGGFKL